MGEFWVLVRCAGCRNTLGFPRGTSIRACPLCAARLVIPSDAAFDALGAPDAAPSAFELRPDPAPRAPDRPADAAPGTSDPAGGALAGWHHSPKSAGAAENQKKPGQTPPPNRKSQ